MSDRLHLASVDGERTITIVGRSPIADGFERLALAIDAGTLPIEKALVVAIVDGRLTFTHLGRLTIVEAVGMLEMASRKVERDARGE